MAINFPNRSRTYDATRRAVRFWGYDRSMESSFFVTADALKQIQPNLRSDAVDLLRAFDINRDRIYAIAAKVYARGRRGSYDLNAWLTFEVDVAVAALTLTAARADIHRTLGPRM